MSDEIGELRNTLARTIGQLKGLEYAVHALVLTHPQPEDLRRVWAGIVVKVVDTHEELPVWDNEFLREGLHHELRLFSQQIGLGR